MTLTKMHGRDIVFQGIAGSHLYGTATEHSDTDIRGVYLYTPQELYGFRRTDVVEFKGVDTVYYSLHKYIELALKGNPNILELLFAPDEYVLHTSWIWKELQERRSKLLAQSVKSPYIGYAVAELKRLERGTSQANRKDLIEKHGYDTKAAAHVVRILTQLAEILEFGTLNPVVRPEWLTAMQAIRNGDVSLDSYLSATKRYLRQVDEYKSKLPLTPPWDEFESFLINTYRKVGT